MKSIILTAALSCIIFLCIGQKAPIKFGNFSMDDMNMVVYDKDSSAVAVILADYGETVLAPGESYFMRHTRIKILKKAGYGLADIAIPVFGSTVKGSIKDFKASTFNLVKGTIEETSLDRTGKFTEEFVNGIEILKFAMNNVREGSIVEYTYKIQYGGIMDWEFQSLIPVRFSQYKIYVSTFLKFNKTIQGYLTPTNYEKKNTYIGSFECEMQSWEMEDVPAFKVEPFISTYKNYISKIKFSLSEWGYSDVFSDWGMLRTNYRRAIFFAENVKGTAFLKNLSRTITSGYSTDGEKVLALFYYVRNKMESNGWNTTFVSEYDIKNAFEKKVGNSAEINLMLLSMLLHIGIHAEPVLISTRDNGFVRQDILNARQFNKVILWVDLGGKFVLLDATDKFLNHDFLPENCINGIGAGYRAGAISFQWVPLSNFLRTKTVLNFNVTIDDNGSVKGSLQSKKNGYTAREVREKFKHNKQKDYFKTLFSTQDFEVTNSSIKDIDTLQTLVEEQHEFILPNYSVKTDSRIYINPVFALRIDENPFKKDEREYPVDFHYPKEIISITRLSIPKEYIIDELPKQSMHMLPNGAGKFIYSCYQSGETITVTTQLVLNNSFFSQEEYLVLKEFYNIITAKQAEQIVLKKK
jgi:hypothetical protein